MTEYINLKQGVTIRIVKSKEYKRGHELAFEMLADKLLESIEGYENMFESIKIENHE